jgi:hypothetical protein
MDFLAANEICEWAAQRGLQRTTGFAIQLPELEPHSRRV